MKSRLLQCIKTSLENERTFAIAFSGGVDSSLLAKIAVDNYNDVTLISIGFPNSHDIEFAKIVSRKMNINHLIYEIRMEEFTKVFQKILNSIPCNNISHIENCIAFCFICLVASSQRFKIVLTANGFDELFCGYDRFRHLFSKGITEIDRFIDEKIENELRLFEEINTMTREYNISIRQPFLSKEFISFSKQIPINKKIKGSDDFLRKHLIREVAVSLNVPLEAALKPKKALQYGSMIHKNLRKILKDNNTKKILSTKINH
ncbi:MAG: asparagine synthase C-terminal domain-containing protein [Nitrososphaeraceae archaeon]|nr:asparagine synthase C-terminal domain-containing protein [Nitrososphaeraceae archaeon]